MSERPESFAERTEEFAIRIVLLYEQLPPSVPAQTFGKQLLRSGSSVGAQYAEAQHSRSSVEFIAKVDGARQEAQESLYWLRLIHRLGCLPADSLQALMQEAGEIKAILITMSANARKRMSQGK